MPKVPGKSYERKSDFEVVNVSQSDALQMVRRWHYAGDGPRTAVFRHGLKHIHSGDIVGCAMWLPPIIAAARKVNPGNPHSVLCLSRLVISPDVATNGASILLGGSIREIRKDDRWETLLTYADDRLDHTGNIYRATNWDFDGKTRPYYAWLDENGRQVCKKATKNIPTSEMDSRYTRVGPFAKSRFVMHLRRPTKLLRRNHA